MKIRYALQLVGGMLIAGAGMYIFFRDVNFGRFLSEIRAMRVWVLCAVAALAIVSLWIRSIRWRLMLPDMPGANRRKLFSLVMIGFMVNNVLPARLGEAARAVLLWRRNGFTPAQSVGSLLLERFIDVMVFMSFFFIPVIIRNNPPQMYGVAVILAGIFAGAISGLVLYSQNPSATRRGAKRVVSLLPQKIRGRALRIGSELISNLDWVFSPKRVMVIILLSVVLTLCYPFMIFLLAGQYGSFTMLDGMFGQACAAFGAAIPLAPGFVGTLHAALQQGLTVQGMDADKAGAVTIIYHAVSYLSVTALGTCFFLGTNITLREIGKAKDELAE